MCVCVCACVYRRCVFDGMLANEYLNVHINTFMCIGMGIGMGMCMCVSVALHIYMCSDQSKLDVYAYSAH